MPDFDLESRVAGAKEPDSSSQLGEQYKKMRRGKPVLKDWYRVALGKREYQPRFGLTTNNQESLSKGVPPVAQSYVESGKTMSDFLAPLAAEVGGGAAKNWLDTIISAPERFKDKIEEEAGEQVASDWMGATVIPSEELAIIQAVGGYMLSAEKFPWDYNNPPIGNKGLPLNQRGEELPLGAMQFDPNGDAYYGEGWEGVRRKFLANSYESAATGAANPLTWGSNIEGQDNWWQKVYQRSWGKYAPARTMARGIGIALMGFFDTIVQQVEVELGSRSLAMEEIALATGRKTYDDFFDSFPTLGKPIGEYDSPFVSKGATGMQRGVDPTAQPMDYSPVKDVAQRLSLSRNAVNNIRMVGALVRGETTIKGIHQAIEDNKDIARMAYSLGANENDTKREFYDRVVVNGENPDLVAMDMEQPISQFIGYIVGDPLNLLDVFLAPIAKWGRMSGALNDVAKTAPEITKVLDNIIAFTPDLTKADQLRVVKGLTAPENAEILARFSNAVGDGMSRVSSGITKEAGSFGLFHRYGSSRRTKAFRNIETFSNVLLQTGGEADKTAEIVHYMAMIGTGDAAKIEAATPALIKMLRNPNMAFSDSGLEFAQYAARMLDDGEGGLDTIKFLKKISQHIDDGNVAGLAEVVLKMTDDAVMAEYPAIKDIIKAQDILDTGGDISKAHPGAMRFLDNGGKIRPIDRAIAVAQDNWWQKTTGNLAGRAFIGSTPGPMVRGATFDTLRSTMEEGLRINMHTPAKWADDSVKWLGIEHPALMQGFSKADVVSLDVWAEAQTGYETMGSLLDAILNRGVPAGELNLSKKLYEGLTNYGGRGMQWFEMKHSQRVVGKSGGDAVIHGIRTGLAKVDDMIAAGLPKNIGKTLQQRLINAFGDSDAVKLALLDELNSGSGLNKYSDLSWVDNTTRELLEDLHIWDDVLDNVQEGSKLENKVALDNLKDDVLAKADELDRLHVRGDARKEKDVVSEAIGGECYDALKKGLVSPEDVDELGNIVQQNRHTIRSVDIAIGDIKRVVESRVRRLTKNDPVAFKKAMEQIDLSFKTDVMRNWDNLVGATGSGNDKLWGGFIDGLMNLPEEQLPSLLDDIWRWYGFEADIPTVINRSEIKDYIWRAWKGMTKTDYATYRMATVDEMFNWIDEFSNFAPQAVIDEVLQLDSVNAVRVNAQRAAELDHVIMVDGVMKPIAGMVRGATRTGDNATAVRGIGSYMSPHIEMIMRGNDLNDTYILQKINKYADEAFTSLNDIEPEIAFEAFSQMRVEEGYPKLFDAFEGMVGHKPSAVVPDTVNDVFKIVQDYKATGKFTPRDGNKLVKLIKENTDGAELRKILGAIDEANPQGSYDEIIELANSVIKGKIDEVPDVVKPFTEIADDDIITIYQGRHPGFDTAIGSTHSSSWSRDYKFANESYAAGSGNVYTKEITGAEWKAAVQETYDQGSRAAISDKAKLVGLEEGRFAPEFAEDAKLAAGLDIDAIPNVKPPYDEQAVTTGRQVFETREEIETAFDTLVAGVENNYGKREYTEVSDELLGLIDEWFDDTAGRMDGIRAGAAKYAQGQRDLVLHDYTGDRFGFDALMSNVYQFHFWPSRTALSFVKTAPYSLGKINKFVQTRNVLGKLHSDAPEWYRYTVNTNEILGTDSDSPIFFNFMDAIMPFNNLMGGFDQPAKRVNWYSSLYDGMGKAPFGYPNIGLGLLVTLALKIQGEDEAAQLSQGRLLPITGLIKGATALAGVDEGKGIEFDPMIRALSEQGMMGEDVLGPYETKRVINMISMLVAGNPELAAQAIDEIRVRSGPLWEQGIIMSRQKDAVGNALSMFTGMNARLRTKDDLTIDQFWTDYIRLWGMSENMTGEELKQNLQLLHEQYPFAELTMLGRRGGEDRDVSYTYSVLGRVEPGTLDNLWEAMGFKYDMFSDFYEAKGFPESWTDGDQEVFMNGVLAIGAALEIPEKATKVEWNTAKVEYQTMREKGKEMFGEDIWELIDGIYEHKEVGVSDQAKWQEYLELFPEVEVAMDWRDDYVLRSDELAPYYGGMDKYRSYLKGRMYDELEEKYGEEIFDKNLIYQNLKNAGLDTEAKNYLNKHKDLKAYRDERPGWYDEIENMIVEFGERLPEGIPSEIRESFDPESYSELDIQKYFERYQAPTYTLDEWAKRIGEPEVNMLLNAYGDFSLPEDIRDYLAGIAADYGLSLQELQDAVGQAD